VGALELVVEVLEVDEDRLPDPCAEERPRDAVVVARHRWVVGERPSPVLREALVDDGPERRLLAGERLALDRVAAVRNDVPGHRNSRDPVFADDRGRPGEGVRPSQQQD
jgi:hypothetical protein